MQPCHLLSVLRTSKQRRVLLWNACSMIEALPLGFWSFCPPVLGTRIVHPTRFHCTQDNPAIKKAFASLDTLGAAVLEWNSRSEFRASSMTHHRIRVSRFTCEGALKPFRAQSTLIAWEKT